MTQAIPGVTYEASCAGKEPFSSPAVATKVRTRRQKRRFNLQTYRCAYCGFFHIGAAPHRAAKARAS